MKNIDTVTMVAVACTRVDETIHAMRKSMKGIHYHDVILITHEKRNLDHYGIKVINIERLDYKAYNHFIIYRLKDYITSDFALVVQYDGYVLRPHEWQDSFLQYDYIGAPWPPHTHFTPEGVNVRVGNGGFSLRSKKLLETPTKLGLQFTDNGTGQFNEDGNICVYYRKTLEAHGIKYAPVSVAAHFSIEKKVPESYPRPFGFHNKAARGWLPQGKKLAIKIRSKIKDETRLKKRVISSWKHALVSRKTPEVYRKTIKVYDIFTFLNELDLLEIRLNVLDPVVDYFVIIEATETFSGKPKELTYEKNKDRFKKWSHKIIHYIIDDIPKDEHDMKRRLENPSLSPLDREVMTMALGSTNVARDRQGKINVVWLKEFYQKELIRKALTSLHDNDICFVSDVDEIWNPAVKLDYRSDAIFKLRQKMYSYFLNNRSSESWIGPLVTQYKNIKHASLNHLRTEKKTKYVYVRNGGWHFTNQGGVENIKTKLESYGHQEYNTTNIKSTLEEKIHSNRDFIGRKFTFWVDERGLPDYLVHHKARYKHMFKKFTSKKEEDSR